MGKTELATHIAQVGLVPKFIDLERGAEDYDVERALVDNRRIESWQELREAIQCVDLWSPEHVPVIDTLSKAEELCTRHVLATVKTDKGTSASSVESYGYGKGYKYVMEEFLRLIADLDRLYEQGRSIVLIMHDCKATVPNPQGEDYIRFEPFLYQSNTDSSKSIREKVKNWLDHLLFIGYDIAVNEDGKARGAGTRFIYTTEQPTFIAKNRGSILPPQGLPYRKGDASLWKTIFQKG